MYYIFVEKHVNTNKYGLVTVNVKIFNVAEEAEKYKTIRELEIEDYQILEQPNKYLCSFDTQLFESESLTDFSFCFE